MSQLERVKKARIHLLLDSPFYATLALELKLVKDNTIFPPTACTDGRNLWFHEDFIKSLSIEQIKTVIAHEILHIAYCHHLREEKREHGKWNRACDYSINGILLEDFARVDGMLYDIKYKDKAAEIIYNELKDEGGGGLSIGEVTAPLEGVNPIEEEIRIKENIVRATQYAKAAGKLPSHIERKMTEYLKPKISWERLLANWVDTKARDNYTWMKKNLRIKNYYFPALYSEDLGTIVVAIDTSGSINDELYNRFCSEINGLREKYKFECILISCDSDIKSVKRFSKYQTLDFSSVNGGGGTRFSPVFNWVQKNAKGVVGLIYFTDLYCSDFPSFKPRYDTVWVNYGSERYHSPPFGKVIDMEV